MRQAIRQPGHEQAGEHGLEQARGQGVGADEGIDPGHERGVEEGPVGRGRIRLREGIPRPVEAVAVARCQPRGSSE